MSVGKTIAELRTAGNMSQQALADALFVSRELVSKWENGLRRPDYRMIEKIANVFCVPAESIIGEKEPALEELLACFSAEAEIPKERLTEILNAFLRRLSARNADVFLRRYYFQQSIVEIAAAYGIGTNHIRSILSKTRKKLKAYIEEESKWTKQRYIMP